MMPPATARLGRALAAEQRLASARRAIERLAEADPRLAEAIKQALGDNDPDHRASAARRAITLIAAAAERGRRR
ncbi:hypothetical protein KO353_04455 [Elioraea tepida]|uniref:Uncharacterized protein n=1 Tax=Elioraea tepida TaxID=2843330 RepID=A0A975U3A0_9PROT|nr:hypothetical protein [Elioraea tepida]QXM25485.1 hypothetical protein KO353_04455 [Elioraea tepida]